MPHLRWCSSRAVADGQGYVRRTHLTVVKFFEGRNRFAGKSGGGCRVELGGVRRGTYGDTSVPARSCDALRAIHNGWVMATIANANRWVAGLPLEFVATHKTFDSGEKP